MGTVPDYGGQAGDGAAGTGRAGCGETGGGGYWAVERGAGVCGGVGRIG